MGFFDGLSDPTQGAGLMGMFANPQTAGLLGMAGGLLQAAGPSRLPVTMGQALGNGFQGMGQGVGNAFQTQQQMLRMRAMQGLMGGDMGQGSGQPQSAPSYSSMFGPASTAPATMSQTYGAAPDTSGAPAQTSGASIYGRSPQQLFQQGMLMNMAGIQGGGDMMRIAVEHDPSLAAQMPTDITKMGVQGGMSPADIQAANAAGVAKANYIAPVNARPGSILRNPLTMAPMAFNPNIPQGGTPLFDAAGNVVGINTIPGAAGVASTMAAAKAGGEGSMLPYSGVDAQGNPLPVTNRTAAATQGGNLPLPLRNNNPGAVSPGGQVAQYPDLQTGLQAMDSNLASYAGKPDTGTLGQIITKWVGSPPNAPAYIKDVTARLGIGANTPVDLTNPAQRQAIATAIMLHENGPGAVFRSGGAPSPGQGAAPAQGGAIYAAPPMGAKAMSDTAQAASAKVMADDYQNMQEVRQNAPAVLQAYDHLLGLANTGGWEGWAANGGLTGKLMSTDAATYASPTAAEYDKTRAFLINAGGAAMGEHNTDSARANLDRMIPEFGKPTQAKIDGINQARNQVAMQALRANVMTPLFQSGDSKMYTDLANQFDTSIKPEMMPSIAPIMQMKGPQQQAAVQAAIKANPALRSGFEVLYNAGMLK